MAIPKGRNAACFAPARKSITGGGDNLARIRTNEQVSTVRDGDRTFRILPECEAGDAESRGFFLDTARVGEDQLCFAQETKKIEVSDGRHEAQLGMMLDAVLDQTLLGARMHWKMMGISAATA